MKHKKTIYIIGLILIFFGIWFISQAIEPSLEKDWTTDQATAPSAEIEENMAHIYNIRNFTHAPDKDPKIHYYNKSFDLDKIQTVDFLISRFSEYEGISHTFLSFGFEGGDYVSVSIEARREKNEKYTPLKGLFKQYELFYVLGDERDLVGLRTDIRKEKVFIFPVKTDVKNIRKLFVDILERVNTLRETPEFYNTLTNNCNGNIIDHVNKIAPERIPFSFIALFPGYADKQALELGLIDDDMPLEKLREKYLVPEGIKAFSDSEGFSRRLRER